jgi:NADH:ubiquinone oxidoreductase subunit K
MHKNLIVVFMCIEAFIVTISYIFLVSSVFFIGVLGFFFSYLLLVIAGAESALALSIVTAYFFIEQHINVEFVNKLKG